MESDKKYSDNLLVSPPPFFSFTSLRTSSRSFTTCNIVDLILLSEYTSTNNKKTNGLISYIVTVMRHKQKIMVKWNLCDRPLVKPSRDNPKIMSLAPNDVYIGDWKIQHTFAMRTEGAIILMRV